MHEFELSPSLMTMDLDKFSEQISFLNDRVSSYHVDIMDGHYVPNLALSPWFIGELKKISTVPVVAHVMATNPSLWVEHLIEQKTEWICLHAEVLNGLAFRLFDKIRAAGLRPGVVINPETPVDVIKPYLDEVDRIIIMTVDPGFAGERFVDKALAKVAELNTLRTQHSLDYKIEIDGSFNKNSFKKMIDAGADCYIIGRSGLFGLSDDIATAWQEMEKQYQEVIGTPMNITV